MYIHAGNSLVLLLVIVQTYVCTYVCTCVCMYVCMYVCTYTRTHVRTYTRTHVRMYTRTHVRTGYSDLVFFLSVSVITCLALCLCDLLLTLSMLFVSGVIDVVLATASVLKVSSLVDCCSTDVCGPCHVQLPAAGVPLPLSFWERTSPVAMGPIPAA